MRRAFLFPLAAIPLLLASACFPDAARGAGAAKSARPGTAPASPETVFLIPGSHQDVGFTDTPSKVLERRIQTLDAVLAAAQADPHFRWTEDAAWSFGAWLDRHRGDEGALEEARRLLGNGQLAIGAAWVAPHASVFQERLNLQFFHLEDFVTTLGHRPPVALLNDASGCPEALVDALAAQGIKYLLVGAHMASPPPLPPGLVRRPFWWESAAGARVLVYVDPDGHLGLGPRPAKLDSSRFSDRRRFPRLRTDLALLDAALRRRQRTAAPGLDADLLQLLGENADVSGALTALDLVRAWNGAGLRPRLTLASPGQYFRHVEEKYGAGLPVLRGEWGEGGDDTRAGAPIWTWRLRQAGRELRPEFPRKARVALATVMDHRLELGPGRPGTFPSDQVPVNALEQSRMFALACGLSLGNAGLTVQPPGPALPAPGEALTPRSGPGGPRTGEVGLSTLPPAWRAVLADTAAIRMRAGRAMPGSLLGAAVPLPGAPLEVTADSTRLLVRVRVDRSRIPGSDTEQTAVVLEIPLRTGAAGAWVASERSPSALAGRFLTGRPPAVTFAPDSARILGVARPVGVTSPTIFAYSLVRDPANPQLTWLRALLVRQELRCRYRNGTSAVLPVEALYPAEPRVLDSWLELNLLP
ncbi:MAG: hypothetical protein HZB25_12515 [Candidatus Eisenbacteria bacterium]|nr:hypothetical protein [Candidatus Eisenbacteria bacterium]